MKCDDNCLECKLSACIYDKQIDKIDEDIEELKRKKYEAYRKKYERTREQRRKYYKKYYIFNDNYNLNFITII